MDWKKGLVRHRRTINSKVYRRESRGRTRVKGGKRGGNGGERGVKDTTTRRSPGSDDVLTLRTRSLIGDDLWRHSIFRPSSKGNRRNKYGHRYVLPIPRTRFTREGKRRGGRVRGRGRGQMFSPIARARGSPPRPPGSTPDVAERFLAPT